MCCTSKVILVLVVVVVSDRIVRLALPIKDFVTDVTGCGCPESCFGS